MNDFPGERSELQADAPPEDLSEYELDKLNGRRRPNGAMKLKELSGKHLRAINLHLSGMKGRAIAQELDMTEAWVSIVLNDPLAQAEIRHRFLEVDNEMFARATAVIDNSMSSEDPLIALRSAEMVWKSRGKFEKREPVRTTAEDVVAKMLELAATTGDASVTIHARTGERSEPLSGPGVMPGERSEP